MNDVVKEQNVSDPIIFARTKTIHLPKGLKEAEAKKKLSDAIYSAETDGSLKQTPLPPISEEGEEEEKVSKPAKKSLWDKISYYLCYVCNNIDSISESLLEFQDPVSSAASPKVVSRPRTTEEIISVPFLPPQRKCDLGKKTLVLDLDETLVHSTFQPEEDCDYILPVTIEGAVYNVYVYLRPGVFDFIEKMSKIYEVVIYTASMEIYANPLLDVMDPTNLISSRLFRNHCIYSDGVYVKDLGLLGRDLNSIIMIDNAAASYKFQTQNGIECIPFINDKADTELMDLTPFLEYLATKDNVRLYTNKWKEARQDLKNNVINTNSL